MPAIRRATSQLQNGTVHCTLRLIPSDLDIVQPNVEPESPSRWRCNSSSNVRTGLIGRAVIATYPIPTVSSGADVIVASAESSSRERGTRAACMTGLRVWDGQGNLSPG